MSLNIDTIRSLDASKTYYIANSTGEIKEAGVWQKFKCFFGIGDGREKAAKLVESVKSALLEASDKISDANLSTSVRNLENTRSRLFFGSGRAIAELAATFTAANAVNIAQIQAGQIAKRPLEEAVKNMQTALLFGNERIDDVMEVMKRAAKPVIDNPPIKIDETGCRVLDEDAFKAELANVLEDAEWTVADVSKASPTGRARFDATVRDMMFATLYGLDGKRNGKDVSAMGSIADIRFNRVMSNVAGYCPTEGVTKEEFAALARKLIDACGEDPDMLDAIEDTARRFLVTGGGKARTPDEIVKRVADCRANQKELFDAIGGDQSNDKKVYNLEFVQGQLNVNLDIVYQHKAILYNGDMVETKNGITVKGGLGYYIAEQEMNRLTGLDLSAYDDTEALEEVNKIGENNMYENRIEKMYDKIPEQYKIDVNYKTHFEVEMRG